MEKLEIKKSIERSKAIIIFTMILLLLIMPSIVMGFTQKTLCFSFLFLIAMAFLLLYKRVQRLNYKLTLLTK
jgi:phosphatidylglycerophosphate synthase